MSPQFERKTKEKRWCEYNKLHKYPHLYYTYPHFTFPSLHIIVNSYKLHFPSSHFSLKPNKKIFHLPPFHPFNQTLMRKNQNFSILPIFHPPTNFSSSHFSTPPTKQSLTLILFCLQQCRMKHPLGSLITRNINQWLHLFSQTKFHFAFVHSTIHITLSLITKADITIICSNE